MGGIVPYPQIPPPSKASSVDFLFSIYNVHNKAISQKLRLVVSALCIINNICIPQVIGDQQESWYDDRPIEIDIRAEVIYNDTYGNGPFQPTGGYVRCRGGGHPVPQLKLRYVR